MSLLNWLRTRSSKNTCRPRARLGVLQLEDRTVPSTLGQIGGAGTELLQAQVMDTSGNVYLAGSFDHAAERTGKAVDSAQSGVGERDAAKQGGKRHVLPCAQVAVLKRRAE